MPAGRVSAGAGGVEIVLQPPIEFILRQTGRFKAALLDFSDLWERFKPVMGEIEQEQFSTRGHGAWPPLAPSTLEQKARRGWPLDPLVRTTELRESLTDPNRAMHISGQEAWYGTDVEYAHWHQTGGYVAGRPPQRQVIPDPLPVDSRRKLETAMVSWINEIAARTFGRI